MANQLRVVAEHKAYRSTASPWKARLPASRRTCLPLNHTNDALLSAAILGPWLIGIACYRPVSLLRHARGYGAASALPGSALQVPLISPEIIPSSFDNSQVSFTLLRNKHVYIGSREGYSTRAEGKEDQVQERMWPMQAQEGMSPHIHAPSLHKLTSHSSNVTKPQRAAYSARRGTSPALDMRRHSSGLPSTRSSAQSNSSPRHQSQGLPQMPTQRLHLLSLHFPVMSQAASRPWLLCFLPARSKQHPLM